MFSLSLASDDGGRAAFKQSLGPSMLSLFQRSIHTILSSHATISVMWLLLYGIYLFRRTPSAVSRSSPFTVVTLSFHRPTRMA